MVATNPQADLPENSDPFLHAAPRASAVESFADPLALAARNAGAVTLADVAPARLRWLWPGRIPRGGVTLLVGDPGRGKSLLTLDIAARVSGGRPWPDDPVAGACDAGTGSEAPATTPLSPGLPVSPSSVLLLTAEDMLAQTIRPRLEAMGADCNRIVAIPAVSSHWDSPSSDPTSDPAPCAAHGDGRDVPRLFELRRDLARLRGLLDAIPDCRLLIVDPISAYLGGTSEYANARVQRLLVPLAVLARERDLAVLAVSHLRKTNCAAVHRTIGSLAFVAAARAAWAVASDPDDARRRLLLPLKNNLVSDSTGLAFTIETRAPGGPAVVQWSPDPVTISAEVVLGGARPGGRPDIDRRHAIRWLQKTLSTGPRPARDVREEADAHGFCEHTLRRAFCDLNGEAVRVGDFPFGRWLWRIPGVEGQPSGR